MLEDESLVQRALQVDKAAWNEQRAMSVLGDLGIIHFVDACLLISWLLEDELLEDESLVQGHCKSIRQCATRSNDLNSGTVDFQQVILLSSQVRVMVCIR